MIYLKQSTAVDVMLGPFIDDTDGKTTEETLTLAQADLQLSKNGAAAAQKNDATAGTHRYGGSYMIDLNATDTDTLGHMRLMCKEAGALPVIANFMVVTANWFDTMCSTDQLDVNVTNVAGTAQTANDNGADINSILTEVAGLDGEAMRGTNNANTVIPPSVAEFEARTVSATAAGNIEDTYDGTGYQNDEAPATQSQVGNIASGTAATNQTVDSFTAAGTEVETNTYESTYALDDTIHLVEPGAGVTDFYYEFDIGANGSPVSISWHGYAASQSDEYLIYAWNWTGTPAWEQIGTKSGINGTSVVTETYDLSIAHVGTGSDAGKVRYRVFSTGATTGTGYGTDRILCSFATIYQSVGYAAGAIWIDTLNGTAGTTDYINGTADNPVLTWANAKTLSSSLGINRFKISNGSTVLLDANSDHLSFYGENWSLQLGAQSIEGLYAEGPNCYITGTATATVTPPSFKNIKFGTVTLPPCGMIDCGYAGHLTGGSAGQYAIKGGFSLVAGIESPEFTFTGLGSATGINVRGWTGGAKYNLDLNCTLSHEVLAGGKTQVVSNAATVELRGITRELDLDLTGAGTIQFVGITGGVDASGTTTATINLYGMSSSITDTTTAATINDYTQSQTDQDAILTDTNSMNDTKIPDILSLANINSEVVDVLKTDTVAEMSQGAPPVSPTMEQMINYIYRQLRNKNETTATETAVYDDAGTTKLFKATLSDNGTIFTKEEHGTGA